MRTRTAEAYPSLDALAHLARAAGRLVFRHYEHGCAAETKADGSPVTPADKEAEALILAGLAEHAPDVPVIAEELAAAGGCAACAGRFFLVDPIDGTNDFVESRRGEFTVNIALVEDGRPILGVIYAPATGRLFAGGDGAAWTQACTPKTAEPLGPPRPIHVRETRGDDLRALTSRRRDAGAEGFLARLKPTSAKPVSSSLKFALVAEGAADLYPRFGPVSEWDIAAGDALLTAAGGKVVDLTGAPLVYGARKPGFAVEGFLALGGADAQERAVGILRV